jgi:hypothetical protein
MSDIKEKIIEAIKSLPDGATYDDIMELVYVQQKIAIGLDQVEQGQLITNEEFEQHCHYKS